MISIIRATENDFLSIASIGRISVTDAHKESCAQEILGEYIDSHYNNVAIRNELEDKNNIYHIIYYNSEPIGFSKIILNAKHKNITKENVTKLDRIYLLKEFHGTKLGFELLNFNIELSKNNAQAGIWLYTWVGNKRAIDFYKRAGFNIIGSHDFLVAKEHYNPNFQMLLSFIES